MSRRVLPLDVVRSRLVASSTSRFRFLAGVLAGSCVAASACASGPSADGAPDYDNSTLPTFSGNPNGNSVNPLNPNNPNPNDGSGDPAGPNGNGGNVGPGNTNGGEPNQSGGTPVTNGNTGNTGNAGNTNDGNPSAGAGGASGQPDGAGNTGNIGNIAGAAGTNSIPPPGDGNPNDPGDQNPPPPPPDPPGDAFFFDDFEAGAVGQQPPRWNRWINYSTNAGNTPNGNQFALVDDQDSFSGDKSVHFRVREGNMPAMLTLALPAQSNTIYLRAMIKTSIQVGGVQPDQVSNHETLLGLRATPNDGNFEIRFGGAKGALGFNMVGPGRNDAVAPPGNLWGSPPGMSAGTWHCVEVAFLNQNPASPVARASLNDTVVRTAGSSADWHVGVTQQWLSGMFTEVIIGWQSFSPAPANDVWMDDIVLSTGPIGCD